MQVRFLQNLGSEDIRAIKEKFRFDLDAKQCLVDGTVDLPDDVAAWLKSKYSDQDGNTSLFEPAGKSKASKQTEPTK